MTRFLTLAALVLLSLAGRASADGCSGCCCGRHGTGLGGSVVPPKLFAYGCYVGNDANGRLIQTGIQSNVAGLLFVTKKTTNVAFCNRWLSPTLLTAGIQGRGMTNCSANEDANLFSGYSANGFIVNNNTTDAGDSLNTLNVDYCWYEWSTAPNWHGTFTYTGTGTSPRTLVLDGAGAIDSKSLILIQNRNNGDSPVPSNSFVGKTSSMTANQSMIWAHATAASSDSNMIRALGNSTVSVGSHLNETGVTYFGAWWNLTDDTRSGTFTWTGNGTSGGNNCATGADVQTFGLASCPITGLLTLEDFFDEIACAHQECDAIRANNINNNISGPGNITSTTNDYLQEQAAPDDTGIRLQSGSFAVTGGASNETSCNDNTSPYFSAFWCGAAPTTSNTIPPTVTRTPTPTNTLVPTATDTPLPTATFTPTSTDSSALDWSGDFIAVWEMDAATNASRPSTGTCTTDCALASNGTTTKNTTTGQFAFGSGGMGPGSISNFLSCASATCDELKLNAVAGATWGCYGYVPLDSDVGTMLYWTTATNRWNVQRTTTNNNVSCQVREAGGTTRTATTALNSWNAATLVFAACTFDDANNELKAYVGNAGFGSAAATSDIGNTTTGNFQSGGGDFAFTGTSDTCFVEDHELSDTDICRLCSCGVNGSLGTCVCTNGGASYTNSGRNVGQCNSCALPACNKAHPD